MSHSPSQDVDSEGSTPMSSPEAEADQAAQDTSPKSLIQTTMKDLFLHSQYSDMTVTCQGFTFKAHRSILCTQSDFFRGAMNGHFKEGITHTVDLPDDDLETVERVLSFLYFNDYNEKTHIMDLGHPLEALEDHPHPDWPTRKERATDFDLGGYTHAEVYVAADKFGIPPLKEYAIKRFQQWCAEYWKYAIFPVTLEHALSIMPPHDEQFQNAIVGTLSADAAEILELESMSKFLDSHGKVASGVISQLVDDDKIWGKSWGEYVVRLINQALWTSKYDRCGVHLQVKATHADFGYLKFCCTFCQRPYDDFQVGLY